MGASGGQYLQPVLFQVIIFQKYTNQRLEPIEAKFVFPLSDSAAVCGFEAFINGKHVVGQVRGGFSRFCSTGNNQQRLRWAFGTAGEGEREGSQRVQAGRGERPRSLPDGPGRARTSSLHRADVASSSADFSLWLQDVFTISVGNLPPAATVLVKVTFVSELIVKDGSILFSLPGSVAPWQGSAALNQTTQASPEPVFQPDGFQPGSCAGYF